MLEKDYYATARRWLKRHGCFATGIDTGLAEARIDAIGIKYVGGELSGKTEVVAIEVKRDATRFGNKVGQALGYSAYADRCYLADVRPSRRGFTDAELRLASHLGVGLLTITEDSRGRLNVTEVLTAPLGSPLDELRLQVVEKLGYSECTICRSLFQRGEADPGGFSRYVSRSGRRLGALKRAVHDERGFLYWLEESDTRNGRGTQLRHRRYLCPDCVWNLFRDFSE